MKWLIIYSDNLVLKEQQTQLLRNNILLALKKQQTQPSHYYDVINYTFRQFSAKRTAISNVV